MLDMLNLRTVDTGAGTTVQLRHISSEAPAANPSPAPNSGRSQINPPRSTVGTVPGQSAAAAGPAALQQIKKAGDANGVVAAAEVANHPPIAQPAIRLFRSWLRPTRSQFRLFRNPIRPIHRPFRRNPAP
jgi:hypothetical protein